MKTIKLLAILAIVVSLVSACQKEEILNADKGAAVTLQNGHLKSGVLGVPIADLIAEIEGMVQDGTLNKGNGNALIVKLNSTMGSLDKNNKDAATDHLQAIIDQVNNFIADGILDSSIGESLISKVQRFISSINWVCGEVFPEFLENRDYKTVKIGEQCWMAENLKATIYNDGEPIPLVILNAEWLVLTTPAYCWVGNNAETYGSVYGVLYNMYAVAYKNPCPTGWHVSTDADWKTLLLGYGGGALKEAGTDHWAEPNTGATNSSGFTALPGGWRYANWTGGFGFSRRLGFWWSPSAENPTDPLGRVMHNDYSSVGRYIYDKNNGLSVRCVKD